MERDFVFQGECIYHIYNRGVEKRTVFNDDNDKLRFQRMLYLANGDKPIVFKRVQGEPLDKDRGTASTAILAYSLMSNHFHIVAKEVHTGGISKFMGKLSTSYSMYFNIKNDRSGPLFCRPFRSKPVGSDDYLRWLMSYVHLNPLDLFQPGWKEKGIGDTSEAKKFLASYPFSSYPDYFGNRLESKIISRDALPFHVNALESVDEMLKDFKARPELPTIEV